MDLRVSVKHLEIDKSHSLILSTVVITCAVAVFCLISAKTLLGNAGYQKRVISAKKDAVTQLQNNIDAINTLEQEYQKFQGNETSATNIIGGSPSGNGPTDGDNARIVLDALPSQYDFPALISSVEKIIADAKVGINEVDATDSGAGSSSGASSNPTPINMKFSIDVTGDYVGDERLVRAFQRSIRPFDFLNLTLNGSSGALHMIGDMTTYYQPPKDFTINQKTVE